MRSAQGISSRSFIPQPSPPLLWSCRTWSWICDKSERIDRARSILHVPVREAHDKWQFFNCKIWHRCQGLNNKYTIGRRREGARALKKFSFRTPQRTVNTCKWFTALHCTRLKINGKTIPSHASRQCGEMKRYVMPFKYHSWAENSSHISTHEISLPKQARGPSNQQR